VVIPFGFFCGKLIKLERFVFQTCSELLAPQVSCHSLINYHKVYMMNVIEKSLNLFKIFMTFSLVAHFDYKFATLTVHKK